ncbi:MAG TPA: hypothetical protein VNO35_21870 [Steroidobacteraceae bacterium]|nr:hypothetical protein [Steroidobacteraceae bacterium]
MELRYFAVIGFALVAAAAIVACHSSSSSEGGVPAPAAANSKGISDEIAWFKGSVDDAFATAAQQNKPLFVMRGCSKMD